MLEAGDELLLACLLSSSSLLFSMRGHFLACFLSLLRQFYALSHVVYERSFSSLPFFSLLLDFLPAFLFIFKPVRPAQLFIFRAFHALSARPVFSASSCCFLHVSSAALSPALFAFFSLPWIELLLLLPWLPAKVRFSFTVGQEGQAAAAAATPPLPRHAIAAMIYLEANVRPAFSWRNKSSIFQEEAGITPRFSDRSRSEDCHCRQVRQHGGSIMSPPPTVTKTKSESETK